ncbi:MAG: hypothetical protein H6741_00570 [Alphaproteobacteria bacterium]|nr:hypothetical protein [Alphaproteobacteria bacterium]MCB9791198.1 hypothetical protein [Alphaproteobacteria bacterium]
MSWTATLERRDAAIAPLLPAAEALLAGDIGPAVAHLAGWRFLDDPVRCERFFAELAASTPTPRPAQLAASLAPSAALPQEGPEDWGMMPPLQRRKTLVELCRGVTVEDSRTARLAWAIDELRLLGRQVEGRQRRAWQDARYAPAPKKDAITLDLWRAWFTNKAFFERERWEKLFLPYAARAFGAVLEARQFPIHVRKQVQEDLQEAFFFALLGGLEGPPGWQELAVRVIETGAAGPVDSVTACLDEPGWRRVATCAVRRGYGPRSAAMAFSELPNALARARAMKEQGLEDPASLERYLDLHVALRLVDTWTEEGRTDLDRSWRVVLQNRGRASGRLRAVLASAEAAPLLERLEATDALYARTVAAVSRHCRDWAWQQLSRGFTFDYGRSVSPPCLEEEEAFEPYDDADIRTLKCWVLLCMLRGRLGHLQVWVREGTTGDRDTQWGRLQKDALPDSLKDPGDASRNRYLRLRAELAEELDALLLGLRPTVEALAALDSLKSKDLAARFQEIIAPHWVEDVPEPKVRYRGYVRNSIDAAAILRELEEDQDED